MATLLKRGGAIWGLIGLLSLARLLWEKTDPADIFRGVILIVLVFIVPALILYRIGADMPEQQDPKERALSSLPIARSKVAESQEETEIEIEEKAHKTTASQQETYILVKDTYIIKSIEDEIPHIRYEIGSICPSCKKQLQKKPKRKTVCPLCGNTIYVRSLPVESTQVLVTENDLSQVQAIWDFSRELIGEIETEIVGQRYPNEDGTDRQIITSRCQTGEDLKLIREPDNKFDANAVKVCNSAGEQMGFLSRDLATLIAPWMDKGFQFSVSVTELRVYQTDHGPSCYCHIKINPKDRDLRWMGRGMVRVPPNWTARTPKKNGVL